MQGSKQQPGGSEEPRGFTRTVSNPSGHPVYPPPPGPPSAAQADPAAPAPQPHPQGLQASIQRVTAAFQQQQAARAQQAHAVPQAAERRSAARQPSTAGLSERAGLDVPDVPAAGASSHGELSPRSQQRLQQGQEQQQGPAVPTAAGLPRIVTQPSTHSASPGGQATQAQQQEPAAAAQEGTPQEGTPSSSHASATGQSFLIPASGAHLPYLWSPQVGAQREGPGKGRSYLDDFGSHPNMQKRGLPSAFASSKDRAEAGREHTDSPSASGAGRHGFFRFFPRATPDRAIDGFASDEDAEDARQPPYSGWRMWMVVFLCSLVALICYIDRAAISVAIIPMSVEFGWTEGAKGGINSVFFIGYTITNIFGGYLATRYTAKLVLGLGVVVWSAFTIATPLAAQASSIYPLLACRVLMGAGEGVTFPAIQHLISSWVPQAQRSRATTLIYSGATMGTVVAYSSAPFVIARYGWHVLFVLYGSAGLLWCMLWVPLVTENPPAVKGHARRREPVLRLGDVPWEEFARSKAVWSILAAQCSQGVGHFLIFIWIPTFYNEYYGEDLKQSSFLSITPWACAIAATILSGVVADALVNRRCLSLTHTRKLMQGIGSLCPAACLFYLAATCQNNGAVHAMIVLTVCLCLEGAEAAGAASNHLDISPRYAAIIFGLTNGLSSIVEALSIYGTGVVLDSTRSWPLVFQVVASIHIGGGIIYLCFASSRRQFE